jgi:hypothetical protein
MLIIWYKHLVVIIAELFFDDMWDGAFEEQ